MTSVIKQLYFVRHAETDQNANGCLQGSGTNYSISSKGRQQAEYLRDSLVDVEFDLAIVTNLIRTKETAMVVLENHPDVPIIEVKELEEISWGILEGQPNQVVKPLIQTWDNGDFTAASPGGESPLQVESRAVPAIYSILESRPESKILFVLHGRLLRIILSSLLHQNLDKMNIFTHHNTSVNIIEACIDNSVESTESLISNVYHYPNITFTAKVLDSRSHLPPEYQQ